MQKPIRFTDDAVTTSEIQAGPHTVRGEADSRWLVGLSGVAVLVSAALLFLVQPMFAKMILPRLGGTPAVWNTCLLFFQTTLLLGYLYVHVGAVRLSLRTQVAVHVTLMLVTLATLPIAVPTGEVTPGGSPVGWLLLTLAKSVGLPFFTVAATAPLLQRWFSLASGRDPYFLYAASNFGSLCGLLGYPLLVERLFRLDAQSALWFGGFALLLALMTISGLMAVRARAPMSSGASVAETRRLAPPTLTQRATWLGLAFVPSSLLLGVTTHISTDVAAVPLLWVVPLALYLLTFSAAFAVRPPISQLWATRVMPLLIVAMLGGLIANQRTWWWLVVHLAGFAVVAMVCHRSLADRRPPAEQLTGYYLWISLGGALGGLFNALVAPMLFTQIVEFPLVLALAAFFRPSPAWRANKQEPWGLLVGIPVLVYTVTIVASWLQPTAGTPLDRITVAFLICASVALVFVNRTQMFAAAVSLLALAHVIHPQQPGSTLMFAARTFFGVHRVLEVSPTRQHRLTHGTTLHGWQNFDARNTCTPTSYYYPSGPAGQLFDAMGDRAKRVGVIGLGAGGLVCYGRPGAQWTFFEIDPMVERIARDPVLFTYLTNARADVNVVIGDGRQMLGRTAPETFDVIVIDAFSSDAIPMHLLTREFLASALERLKPGGVLAFHISNVYFDLEPVVAASLRGLAGAALFQYFISTNPDGLDSEWMVAARSPDDLAALASDSQWRVARPGPQGWTDDRSNIFDAIHWPK